MKTFPFPKLPKLTCGTLACILLFPCLGLSQGNEFESNFSAQTVYWSASGSWTRISGEGDVPTSQADSVRIIQNFENRYDLRVDVDDVHIKLLEYTAETDGSDPVGQFIFANGTRTLKIDTLTKKGSYAVYVANGMIGAGTPQDPRVEQSLSLEIGNLNIEGGYFNIAYGTSAGSVGTLNAFTVTGTTTIASVARLYNRGVKNRAAEGNHVHLGHLVNSGRLILGASGNSNGVVEVASLSGNGTVFVSESGTHNGTAGTLHFNNTNTTPETFSGRLADYNNASQPATLTILKTGSGTQIFSRSSGNDYSGTTTISEGVLAVTNTSGSGLGTGSVEVGGTGVLAGSGHIAPGKRRVFADEEDEVGTEVGNTVTVHAGGGIAPSAHLATDVATLTLFGTGNLGATILNMEEGASFSFRLGLDDSSDRIHFDGYHADGLQLFSGGIDINILDAQVGEFTLFTFNSISDTELEALYGMLNLGTGLENHTASLSWSTNAISLEVQAIPEPGETALLLIGLAGMAGWRIYRKRTKMIPLA